MVEKKILGHKSPLYGRQTRQILLRPFNFSDVFRYLSKSLSECVELYSVFGGTPAYVIEIDREKLLENIADKVLRQDSPFTKMSSFCQGRN